jgi:hypothetical protein
MPEMNLEPTFAFRLNQTDTLLVLKALGGRLRVDEVPVARALGDLLTAHRAEELERTARQLRDALR